MPGGPRIAIDAMGGDSGPAAMVGDVLFQGSIGRWDFPHGNHQQLVDSITGRLWPMGDDTSFVPGHGPMSTFGHERATNPLVGDAVLARSRAGA